MKIEITNKPHEQTYLRSRGYNTIFTITESIHKTHFKSLMQLAKMYDATAKTGFILDSDKEKFTALVAKIEKANSESAKRSHAKTIAQKKDKVSFLEWKNEIADMPERDENGEWFDLETGLYFNEKVQEVYKEALNKAKTVEVKKIAHDPKKVFTCLIDLDFEIEKGENGRYFLIKNGQAQGEILNVLNDSEIKIKFDKIEFNTTLSIAERSNIHSKIREIQK